MLEEYYPTPPEILSALGSECILVGSARFKSLAACKDIDFVVSDKGLSILKNWQRWLIWDSPKWAVLMPLNIYGPYKTIEFFGEIANISDHYKHFDRISYEEAIASPLDTKDIYGITVSRLA